MNSIFWFTNKQLWLVSVFPHIFIVSILDRNFCGSTEELAEVGRRLTFYDKINFEYHTKTPQDYIYFYLILFHFYAQNKFFYVSEVSNWINFQPLPSMEVIGPLHPLVIRKPARVSGAMEWPFSEFLIIEELKLFFNPGIANIW